MKKLHIAFIFIGLFHLIPTTYAMSEEELKLRLARYPRWGYSDDRQQVSKDSVSLCVGLFHGNTIYSFGEKFDCGTFGSTYVVNLRERIIHNANTVFDNDLSRDGIGLALSDESYHRFELLRSELLDPEIRQEYLREFEAAESLVLINEFKNKYAYQDPDSLIPKLAPLKAQLEHQEYLDLYAQADTTEKLENFIGRYENNDPDELVLKAKNRLTKIKIKERAEQDILDNKIIAEKKQREIDSVVTQKQRVIDNLASKILWCNRQILFAHQTINKEREIAQVSGYENKFTLRQAGEIIVNCRNSIKRDFEDYRRKGGTRSLAELNN